MNLSDLHKAAAEEGVDVSSKPSDKVELTDGEEYSVTVEKARNDGVNKNGTQCYSVMCRVLAGPDNVNRVYWQNFYISPKETSASFNARNFHYMDVLGLTLDVLMSVEGVDKDASEAPMLAATKGRVFTCTAGYDGDFTRNHYAAEAVATVEVPVDDDVPVEDDPFA
tara:strand:- start:155 stop:655 length:501 start_codon:yes stop_codon:yes gene_type:complete